VLTGPAIVGGFTLAGAAIGGAAGLTSDVAYSVGKGWRRWTQVGLEVIGALLGPQNQPPLPPDPTPVVNPTVTPAPTPATVQIDTSGARRPKNDERRKKDEI
jgi:hypothetical protein